MCVVIKIWLLFFYFIIFQKCKRKFILIKLGQEKKRNKLNFKCRSWKTLYNGHAILYALQQKIQFNMRLAKCPIFLYLRPRSSYHTSSKNSLPEQLSNEKYIHLDLHKLEHNCIIREPNIIKQTSSENEILLSSDLKLVSQAMGLVITLDITGDI